jgi:hypothetical protein
LAQELRAREIEIASKTRSVRPRPPIDKRKRLARLKEIETKIATLEGQLAKLSLQLENPAISPQQVQEWGEDYVQIQNEIQAWLVEWERLQD